MANATVTDATGSDLPFDDGSLGNKGLASPEKVAEKLGAGESTPKPGTVLVANNQGQTSWQKIDLNLHVSGSSGLWVTSRSGGYQSNEVFTAGVTGSPTLVFGGGYGMAWSTTTAVAGAALNFLIIGERVFDNNPTLRFHVRFGIASGFPTSKTLACYVLGEAALATNDISYSTNCLGIEFARNSGGTYLLNGVSSSGGTSTTVTLYSGVATTDAFEVVITLTSGSEAQFFYKLNGGVTTFGGSITTNLPAPSVNVTTMYNGFTTSGTAAAVTGPLAYGYSYHR